MFDRSNPQSKVFRTEAPLQPSHTPDSLKGRENEIDAIVESLQRLARGNPADHLFIHGPPGVGKTTCVDHVLDHLDRETPIETVRINCWQYNTRPALLTELLIELGYPAPRKGKPVDEILSKLEEWLDKNRSVAVALDEFDQLQAPSEIVYDLHRTSQAAASNIGMIFIADNVDVRAELLPRCQSRVPMQMVEFQPYTASDLIAILESRIDQAFRSGVVSDDAVEFIAERVAEGRGDCREAFRLLLRAGRRADQQGLREVTIDHVQAAAKEDGMTEVER